MDLAGLKKGQAVGGVRVENLYSDSDCKIVGAKFRHIRSGAPIYFFQIDTVPQVFMWVDTPATSNNGLAHALEHLLGGKGTKGRYLNLLKEMRLSRNAAATTDDFNMYSFSSGTGLAAFFEQLHAWLEALYRPDFTDLEAEREFYHFGIALDPSTKTRTLVERGSVYDEMQMGQGIYTYYFELNKRVFGADNPFGFYSSGVPDEMRQVVPVDIRRFHREHYRLSAKTGFIFATDPKENVAAFLYRVSAELDQFADSGKPIQTANPPILPKYSVHPSMNTEIALFPFPSSSEADRGEVRFGWKPVKANSQADLKLLQLFLRALADGEKSVLYKSLIDSKTRDFDSGATNVESLVFLENSPYFPSEFVGFSGIPGKQMTVQRVEQLRSHIIRRIQQIAQYPDNSASLAAFNQLVATDARAWRRAQSVWVKTAPRFGLNYETGLKEYLEYLEMDPSFTRSISDDRVWTAAEKQMQTGKNIWALLIRNFQLSEIPYATGSIPSPKLLEENDNDRQNRVSSKLKQLVDRFQANDEQEALARFEQEESLKTKEIDQIAARVRRPRFTDSPPLTPDDDVKYSEFRLGGVPVITTFFERAPTIDLGLSFDLRKVPKRYYKYLPILPRCLDSLGLRTADNTLSYSDLQAKIHAELNDFAVRYDFNPASRRADLRIQLSAVSPTELRRGLNLIQSITTINYLDPSNADRLRDVVQRRQWEDDAYDSGENDYWFMNPSNAFRYQDDPLYLALTSVLTQAHWDGRLMWMLHKPVGPAEIAELNRFAARTIATLAGKSGKQLSEILDGMNENGLERELLDYWKRNIPSFPQEHLLKGLKQLALEVEEDLKAGPASTIANLRALQRIVIKRGALKIDLTLDPKNLEAANAELSGFLESIPDNPNKGEQFESAGYTLLDNVARRYNLQEAGFPQFVGLGDIKSDTANMIFYADFPSYSQVDHQSLLEVLSSKLISGSGPDTVYTKTGEQGLAYASSISSDPSARLLRYYALRTSDIPTIIELVNSVAGSIPHLQDDFLVDYAFQKTFSPPRSMMTFSERGRGIARDIWDGNDPTQVRRFSEAVLQLRSEPNLLHELIEAGKSAICPVLVMKECAQQQHRARSVFFFTGPERLLADAEKKLDIPKLLRLYPSDFWIDYSESNPSAKTANALKTSHVDANSAQFILSPN
jgi:Zn-dependent M16 (insulinase) family peptidase